MSRVYPKGVKVGEVYSISIGHTVADKTYFGKNISITATSEDSSLLIEAFITAIQERITADTENTTAWSQLVSYTKFICLLYTSPSPRDGATSRMPSSA